MSSRSNGTLKAFKVKWKSLSNSIELTCALANCSQLSSYSHRFFTRKKNTHKLCKFTVRYRIGKTFVMFRVRRVLNVHFCQPFSCLQHIPIFFLIFPHLQMVACVYLGKRHRRTGRKGRKGRRLCTCIRMESFPMDLLMIQNYFAN